MTIYQSNENRPISELLLWDLSNSSNAPFIRIGKLLLAVDQTGAEAWQPLINTLKKKHSANNFMLYSGRHGAMEGCFQDNGLVPATAPNEGFYKDDEEEAKRFAPLAKVEIQVVDTGQLPKLLYKQRVKADINSGNWVIVAWCHSIASMRTIPNNALPNYMEGSHLWTLANTMNLNRICDIVRDDYGWVPRLPGDPK